MILFILFAYNIYSVANNNVGSNVNSNVDELVNELNNNIIDDFSNDWSILINEGYLILTKTNDNTGWELTKNIDGTSYMFTKDNDKTNLLLLTNIIDGNTWYLIRSSDGVNWKLVNNDNNDNNNYKFVKEDTNWILNDTSLCLMLKKDNFIWRIYKNMNTKYSLSRVDKNITKFEWSYINEYTDDIKHDTYTYIMFPNNTNIIYSLIKVTNITNTQSYWLIEKNKNLYWNITNNGNQWILINSNNDRIISTMDSFLWSPEAEETIIDISYNDNIKSNSWYLTKAYGSYWAITDNNNNVWMLTKEGVNIWNTIEKNNVWVLTKPTIITDTKKDKSLSTNAIVGITAGGIIFIIIVVYTITHIKCGNCNLNFQFRRLKRREIMP